MTPPLEQQLQVLSIMADGQQGVITFSQAGLAGVDATALAQLRDAGLLVELGWQVYQLASSSLDPVYAFPYAAWLAISPDRYGWERPQDPTQDAVLSHESACQLHGIGSSAAPTMVFTAPTELTAPRAVTIHVAQLSPAEVMMVAEVPVTTPHRTLLDLVRDWASHEEIGRAISAAARRDLIDLSALYRDLAPLAAQRHLPGSSRDFLAYFLPDLPPASLPLRNRLAYAELSGRPIDG